MSGPTYSITMTDAERRQLADALGMLVQKLTNAAPVLDGDPRALPQASPAAAPPTNTPELRDRWARDRKGNEVANPEGAEALEVSLNKPQTKKGKDGDYMHVTWPANTQRGFVDANCFDSALFPWIIKAAMERKARIYVVRKGNYLNIVGVHA